MVKSCTTFLFILFFLHFSIQSHSQQKNTEIRFISGFPNVTNPQIAYWFFSKDQISSVTYKRKIDSIASFSKYDLLFLTARNGLDFYDTVTMKPVFAELVKYAHAKGLKIGLQLWEDRADVPIEKTERIIQEDEVKLDENGRASCVIVAKHVRNKKLFIKSELFQAKLFRKLNEGFYEEESLKDITSEVKTSSNKDTLFLNLNLNSKYKNYTAYILTQHYYNAWAYYSKDATATLTNIIKSYTSIPFDAVGLDEFTNLRISTTWELKNNDVFRERPYSLPMADEFRKKTNMSLGQTLFDMRYVKAGDSATRIKAINAYMELMRYRTLGIENEVYRAGKLYFGKNTFIGLHNTHHNYLDGDEIWQTGLNWWNVKRDIGHTDEETPTPIQMGVGMSYPSHVLYNMYYNKSLDRIWQKSLTDLRYGIRTHYHAINDIQSWGVSVEKPEALKYINKVENCARLINLFNPSFPKIKLLVVFGMESLSNWYPDYSSRNTHDLNGSLKIEKKVNQLWDAGYLNAVVPTDVINDGRLTIDDNGRLTLQGNKYDALVMLYPEYAKKKTIDFLLEYTKRGGKILTEGMLTKNFNGINVSSIWSEITKNAVATNFSLNAIGKLGVKKNDIEYGVQNEDGSYTFTDTTSLRTGEATQFKFVKNGIVFSGKYAGIAVIKIDENNSVVKIAATGFKSIEKNGLTIFSLSQPADIFIERAKQKLNITIADESGSTAIIENKLIQ